MRNNNFDILRLLCAMFVIVSHSYALLGMKNGEVLYSLTNGIILSDIGLLGFFTISGYLIYQSLINSRNTVSYLGKRCLRIFPSLLVCLILVVIVCSFVYNGDGAYFKQLETYVFVLHNILLYPVQWGISGVFEQNPISTVNGSLWTLAYEFTMYLLLIILFFVRNQKVKIALVATCIIGLLTKNTIFAGNFNNTEICYLNVSSFTRFAQYFAVGVLMQMLSVATWTKKSRMILLSVCGILAFYTREHTYMNTRALAMLCLSVAFIVVGEMCWKSICRFVHKVGDLSYGTYIYAFPISQLLITQISGLTPTMLTLLTLLIVLPIAYLSWRYIEKPALSLKQYL